jgi:transcriptional regulator with XRE-family HTH domain
MVFLAQKDKRGILTPFFMQKTRLRGTIEVENESQENVSRNLNVGKEPSTTLNSKEILVQRLQRGRTARARFVESNISKALAFQTRALREKEGWSQQYLAEKIGSNQNAVYRAENPNYGKQTVTTLKKIAAAFDVGLAVRFVPFSELVDWVSETPRTIVGLTTEALTVPSFGSEDAAGVFDAKGRIPPQPARDFRIPIPAMPLNNTASQEPTSPLDDVKAFSAKVPGIIDIGTVRDAQMCGRQDSQTDRLASCGGI